MKKILFFALLLVVLGVASVSAQVRIGSDLPPNDAALLDLNATDAINNGTKGLALPRVNFSTNTAQITSGVANLTGMLVYNTNTTLGVGVYYWDAAKWVKLSDGSFVEVDGIIGNEVTNATTGGGLERSGSGTAVSPYTLGIANNSVTTARIADNAVTTAKIADGTIATADIANNAVTVAKLPTGASSTTYLRGDGTWQTPPNTTYTGSTSIILSGTSFVRAALSGDVTAVQNSNAVSINNGAITRPKTTMVMARVSASSLGLTAGSKYTAPYPAGCDYNNAWFVTQCDGFCLTYLAADGAALVRFTAAASSSNDWVHFRCF